MIKSWRVNKGFTLIELLIVVAIIGILAAIAVPNFLNARIRAKIAGTQSDLCIMRDAMIEYSIDNNSYHAHRDGADQQFPLTTPVAYLRGFLKDRFQARPDIYNAPGFQYSFTYYHWIPCSSHVDWWPITGDRSQETVFEAQNQKFGGLIDGWGPAGVRGGPPYNPSNGLISIGGFMILVPGGTKIHLRNQNCGDLVR